MSNDFQSDYRSAPRGDRSRPATPLDIVPVPVLRALLGFFALLGFVCGGMCFYFLVQPFGANPPPKEVALGAGIVFTCIGLGLAGVAVFYRFPRTESEADEPAPYTLPDAPQRWSPAAGIAGYADALETPSVREPKPRRGLASELMGVVALLGIFIGPGLAYLAYQRQQVLRMGKSEARVMRVADLGKNGPGDNIHVKVTDFEFGNKYALRTKGGSWTAVCLAAFPTGKVGDARALRVVIRTSRVRDEQELREFGKRARIEGVVVNSIYEWENDKEYMKEAYPGVDTSAIWVVQENYTFPNESEIKTMYTISSGVVGLAVFCGIGMFIRKRG